MTAVSKDKTVRIHVDPIIPEADATAKLANYFRSELKKRSKVQDVDLS